MAERIDSQALPRGLISSVLEGYGDLHVSTQARLASRPRASEAYAWLIAAGLLIFGANLVTQVAKARAEGLVPGDQLLAQWTTSAMLGAIAFVPAATALAAVPVWLLLRTGFGGRATCRETAVTAAWAVLLSAPICALGSLLQAGIHVSALAEGPAKLVVFAGDAAALAVSVWIWSRCTASAHGFRSGRWLFVGTAVLGGAGWWVALGTAGS